MNSTGIITGATGSFDNIECSGILTGSTGSFKQVICSGTVTGHTGHFDYIRVDVINGTGCSFDYGTIGRFNCDKAEGTTGSFHGFTGSTGSFKYLSATTFTSTSDYRIKGNIQTLDHSFNVDKLRPVTYINNLSNKQDIGLIAHELQEEYPFLVNGEKDGVETQSVNYTGIIGILVSEIKSLKQRVSALEP